MIEIRNLHKAFGPQQVLQGVDLKIPRGKITAVMGPSGEGKSVLLKHLIGLLRPDRGEVLVEGVDICRLSVRDLNRVRRKFGMLFQDAALFDYMTVFENVSFPLFELPVLWSYRQPGRPSCARPVERSAPGSTRRWKSPGWSNPRIYWLLSRLARAPLTGRRVQWPSERL